MKIVVSLILCLSTAGVYSQSKTSIEGFIQSSGLPDSFKKKLNLNQSEYLLTDTEQRYLIESKKVSEVHWGKYVRIYGEILEPKEWVFDSKILKIDSLIIIPFQNKEADNSNMNKGSQNDEPTLLTGELARNRRPAPDIKYDYILKVKEPIKQENPPSGEAYILVSELPVSWLDLNMINDFERYIKKGNEVKLLGYLVSGYAESLVFETLEIK